jgi:hypothetical protein
VVVFDSAAAAKQGFEDLKTYHAISGHGFLSAKLPGDAHFSAQTAYHGVLLAFQTDRYLAGVQDLTKAEQGVSLIQALFENFDQRKGRQ